MADEENFTEEEQDAEVAPEVPTAFATRVAWSGREGAYLGERPEQPRDARHA